MEQEANEMDNSKPNRMCDVGQLACFEGKIREAISLVRSMTTEDKLKAVQYWNAVSENLQDIVNSSADDISALASQLSERESLITREHIKLPRSHLSHHPVAVNQSPGHFLPSSEILPQLSLSQNVKVLQQSHMETTSALFHLEDKQPDTSMMSTDLLDQYLTGSSHVVTSGHEEQGQPSLPVMVDSCDAFSSSVGIGDQVHDASTLDPLAPAVGNNLQGVAGSNPHLTSHRIIVEDQFQSGSAHELDDEDDPLPLPDIQLSDAETRELGVEDLDVSISDTGSGSSSQNAELTAEEKNELGNLEDLEKYLTVARNGKGVPVLNFFTKQAVASDMEGGSHFEYVCNLCKKSFLSIRYFYLHFAEHTKPIVCPVCGISLTSRAERRKHMYMQHSVAEKLVQHIASERMSEDAANENLTKGIAAERMAKDVTLERIAKDAAVERVEKNVTAGRLVKDASLERPVRSNSTEKVSKETLLDAMASIDSLQSSRDVTKSSSRQCKVCGRQCSTISNLTRHMRTHTGDRPFQCSTCGKRFREKKSLQTHERLHSGERPYQCTMCAARFLQLSNLNEHLETHSSTKRHLCEVCGKSFRQPAQLKVHKSRHEGRKAHRCDKCPMAFNVLNDLKRHRHSHLDEKPFKCSECSKSFPRQQALAEHMNRHQGKKPYDCGLCTKRYADLSAYHKHMKRVHKNKTKPSPKAGNTLSELGEAAHGEALFVVSDVSV